MSNIISSTTTTNMMDATPFYSEFRFITFKTTYFEIPLYFTSKKILSPLKQSVILLRKKISRNKLTVKISPLSFRNECTYSMLALNFITILSTDILYISQT